MSKKRNSPTFKDILGEATWSERDDDPRGEHAIRPGAFNIAGEFFDQSGARLTRTGEATPAEAQRLVADGAHIAFEGCGCGGWNGCSPEWFTGDSLAELRAAPKPRFVKGYGSPTWIDVWEGDSGKVVFAHGDVKWGASLG